MTGYRHLASHGHTLSGRFTISQIHKSELSIRVFLVAPPPRLSLGCLFFPVSCQSRLHVARAWNCLVHLHASTSARPLNLISFWDRVYHYIRRCLVQKVARILNGFMLDRVTIQIVFATTLESSPSTPCIDGFMDNERVLHLRRDNYLITLSTSSCSARNLEYSPVEAVPRPTQVVVVEQVKPLELELGRMR